MTNSQNGYNYGNNSQVEKCRFLYQFHYKIQCFRYQLHLLCHTCLADSVFGATAHLMLILHCIKMLKIERALALDHYLAETLSSGVGLCTRKEKAEQRETSILLMDCVKFWRLNQPICLKREQTRMTNGVSESIHEEDEDRVGNNVLQQRM